MELELSIILSFDEFQDPVAAEVIMSLDVPLASFYRDASSAAWGGPILLETCSVDVETSRGYFRSAI